MMGPSPPRQPGFSETMPLGVPAEYAFAFLADPSTARVIDPAVRECTYTWAMDFHGSGPLGTIVGRSFGRFMHANAKAQQQLFRAEVERRFRMAWRAP